MFYILSVCAVVAAIVIVLVMNKRRTQERAQMVAHDKSAVAVKVMEAEESTYSSQFSSSGVLQARRELAFVSDIAGRIVDIYVDEGSHTHKGQVLIQLDNEMLLADVPARPPTRPEKDTSDTRAPTSWEGLPFSSWTTSVPRWWRPKAATPPANAVWPMPP